MRERTGITCGASFPGRSAERPCAKAWRMYNNARETMVEQGSLPNVSRNDASAPLPFPSAVQGGGAGVDSCSTVAPGERRTGSTLPLRNNPHQGPASATPFPRNSTRCRFPRLHSPECMDIVVSSAANQFHGIDWSRRGMKRSSPGPCCLPPPVDGIVSESRRAAPATPSRVAKLWRTSSQPNRLTRSQRRTTPLTPADSV
jgi:hypothetical protein